MPISNNQKFVIYGLFDPRNGELRYVGQTSRELIIRLYNHLNKRDLRKNNHKNNWIKELLSNNLKPEIEAIEIVTDSNELNDAEVFWIAYFKSIGCRLTNATSGGLGIRGLIFSAEHRANLSKSTKGRKSPMEGRNHSASTKNKLSLQRLGNKHALGTIKDEAFKLKMSRFHGCRPFQDQFGNRYETLSEAARKLGLDPSSVGKVLSGKLKKTGGYIFRFIEGQ